MAEGTRLTKISFEACKEDVRVITRKLWFSAALALVLALSAGVTERASAQAPAGPAAVPGAPSGLTYYVNGNIISLQWTAPAANFTHYVLEAGFAPGQVAITFPTSLLADPTLLTERLAAFNAHGIGSGSYYLRLRAANNEGVGGVSNEILLPVTGGCQPAGPATDLTAIVRGSNAWIQWQLGSGGLQNFFYLVARSTPTGDPIAIIPTSNFFINVNSIPPGTFYLSVYTVGRCGGIAAESNQIVVTAPSNTPAFTPNPSGGGRLPLPFVVDVIQQFSAANPGLLQASCPNPNSKYTLNPFINALVDHLRTIDQRFGYNSKPTRGPADNGGQPVVVAGDEIAYHFGADAPEGSPNTYLIDVIFGHCGTPSLTYRNFSFQEFGKWTGAGRF
jgi:hypothetical protein